MKSTLTFKRENMKLSMVFCALVATVSLHAQASATVTQNSTTSSWTHDLNNESNSGVYFGGASLTKNNDNYFPALSDRYINWKTPADAMQFVYDYSNNVMFSTVDAHSSFDATLTVIKWVGNRPDSIVQCESIVTDIYGNYGYTLEYDASKKLSATLFDRPHTTHIKPNDQCEISFKAAKNNIPKSIQ